MRNNDLHEIPKIRDQISYLYTEHCRIDKDNNAIAIYNEMGVTPVPCANLTLLMLGPGVSITHAAVMALEDNGCLLVWCGEQGVRFYAVGCGTTRNAAHHLRQAALWARSSTRLEVVRRMYSLRFDEALDPKLTLQQIRGMEGVRIRDAYAKASRDTGIDWKGRNYNARSWRESDPVNRALSAANACLYGVCHAAIVAAGFTPAIGFIHTGLQLSFVYDVADFYKTEITIPVSFNTAKEVSANVEREARIRCRNAFQETHLLKRIIKDIDNVLNVDLLIDDEDRRDGNVFIPGDLWDPETGIAEGGISYGDNDISGEDV